MTYYDKSLVEVWEWKDQVSESLKLLTLPERLAKLTESAEKRRLQRNLQRATENQGLKLVG